LQNEIISHIAASSYPLSDIIQPRVLPNTQYYFTYVCRMRSTSDPRYHSLVCSSH